MLNRVKYVHYYFFKKVNPYISLAIMLLLSSDAVTIQVFASLFLFQNTWQI